MILCKAALNKHCEKRYINRIDLIIFFVITNKKTIKKITNICCVFQKTEPSA